MIKELFVVGRKYAMTFLSKKKEKKVFFSECIEYDEKKYKAISLSELFYLCYFAVMLGAKAIGLYEGQTLYNVCLILGAAFFGLKIISTKHSAKEYLVIGALLLLGVVVYLQSGEKSLLICFTMMLGMKNVSVDRVFKLGAAIWITSFVTMYVLAVIGVIPEYASTPLREGWPLVIRHSLGYPHPNSLHASYFVLVVFVLFIYRKLPKGYLTALSVVMLLGNGYVFMYSLSRNGFLITFFYIILNLYLVFRVHRSKVENLILMSLLPLGVFFIIAAPILTGGELFDKLNTVLAGRFEYTRYFLTYEPLRLFGIENIPVPTSAEYVIDSSYVYLVFRLGLVAFFLVLCMMFFTLYDALKNERIGEAAILLSFYMYGIVELYLFNQSYKNLTFIFIGSCLFRVMSQKTEKGIAIFENKKQHCLMIRRNITEKNPIIPINIWIFDVAVLIVVGVIVSCLYTALIPEPHDIYLPRSEEMASGDGIETYLTEEEVKKLRKSGDIVRGYVDENTPVYRMQSKSVAKAERVRYEVSFGLWGGCIAFFIFLFVWVTRSKVRILLQNKTIGSDYKEKILIVHNYYKVPGGEDIVVANEKKMLEEHGHKVVCYFRHNDELKDSSIFSKIGLAFNSIFSLRTYIDICKIIDKEKVDIIHVHNTVAMVSPAVYIAGINRNIPIVQTVHNFRLVCPNGLCYVKGHVCEKCINYGLKASLINNCYRDSRLQTFVMSLGMRIQRAIRTYAAINFICLTEFNKSKLLSIKQIRESQIYLKPNFTQKATVVVPYEQRKRQIVYAGRLEKIKGIEILLQAWMKLGDKAPKLILCGSGELDEWCREYIENNELNNVELMGQVDNDTAKALIGESMAMIHPTQLYEGFPMTIAEAYSLGTPIIASDLGNVGSLVIDNVSGVKFKSSSAVSLAKAVEKFMSKPVILPSEYLTKYSEEKNYEMLKEIYEDVRRRKLI